MSNDRDRRGDTNARIAVAALAAIIVAIVLFWIAEHGNWLTGPWRATMSQIAGTIFATALLAMAWDVFGRRRFADEILAKAQLSADVVDAGVLRVTDQYLEDVEWADLFEGATRVDVVVAYAITWRNTHMHRLRKVAQNPDARLRVFLPDPSDAPTMAAFADRFAATPQEVSERVKAAIADFSALSVGAKGTVEIYLRAGDLVFSCYRFDQRAVITLYSHGRIRQNEVPTFVVGTGRLYKFIQKEVAAIAEQSRPYK